MIEPAQADPLVGTLSTVIGGPRGQHARGYLRWLPASAVIAVLAAATCALGMLQKSACAARGWDSSIRYTHLCASEVPGAYSAQGLDHPVVTTYWAYAAAQVTRWLHDSATMFVIVNAVGFALLAIVAALLLSRVRPDRPWDAAAFAASPALLLTGIMNWEMLSVLAVAGALWAYSRGDLGLTGVLIGAGAAAGFYPVLLLVALLALAVRRRAWFAWLVVTAAAVAAWLVLNLPAMLTRWDSWSGFWSSAAHHSAGAGSAWLLLQDATGRTIPSGTVNLCATIILGALCVGIVALGAFADHEPSFAELGLLSVLSFVFIDKVYAPQNVLWLLPLAVLARPRWRDQLIWQGAEVLFFCVTMWNLAGLMTSGDGPAAMYDIAIAVRLGAEIGLAALVVHALLRRQRMTVSSNVVVV